MKHCHCQPALSGLAPSSNTMRRGITVVVIVDVVVVFVVVGVRAVLNYFPPLI